MQMIDTEYELAREAEIERDVNTFAATLKHRPVERVPVSLATAAANCYQASEMQASMYHHTWANELYALGALCSRIRETFTVAGAMDPETQAEAAALMAPLAELACRKADEGIQSYLDWKHDR